MTFASFEDYRALGGKMDKSTFNKVKKAHWSHEQYCEIFKELRNENMGSPNYNQINIYAKISVINPDKSTLWKIIEMCLVQGNKEHHASSC